MKKSLRRPKERKTPECPECHSLECVWALWRQAVAGEEATSAHLPRILLRERALRAGSLLRCPRCAARYFLDAEEVYFYWIHPRRLKLVERWSAAPLRPDAAQFEALRRIGAAPIQRPIDGPIVQVSIPCRVKTKRYRIADPAVVLFQKHPPLDEWQQKLKLELFDQVATIAESEYALSRRVRYETTRAEDVTGHGMFFPTGVETRDGRRRFSLNGAVDLLKLEGVKGCDLVLPAAPWHLGPAGPKLEEVKGPLREIVYFVADWSPEAEALRFGSGDL